MADSQQLPQVAATVSRERGSLIFISHDTRDAELAEAFSKLLNGVSAGVLKSFRSSDRKGGQGIEYGVEWYPELMSKLEAASDVVCLLTQRSLERPWILYEAGVAKGKLNTPVYGIALGIPLNRASSGPFAQFQNCADGEAELTKLVSQLVGRIPGAEPDIEALQMQVKTFKERAAKALKASEAVDDPATDQPAEASVAKLFEEIKVMFQDLPSRIEPRMAIPIRSRSFHPLLIDELLIHLENSPDDPIGLLLVASMLREEVPWLYELAMEAYRSARIGDASTLTEHMSRIQRALDFDGRGAGMEGWNLSKDGYFILRELLPRFMARFHKGRYRIRRLKFEPQDPPKAKASSPPLGASDEKPKKEQ